MPADVDATKFMVWYVGDDGTLEPMNGHPNADGTYTFTTTHFSVYVGGTIVSGATVDTENSTTTVTGNLVSGTQYVLDTDGVIETGSANKSVIVGSGENENLALNRNNLNGSGTTVSISGNTITSGVNTNNNEFYFEDNSSEENGTYLLTQNGTNTVKHAGGNLSYVSEYDGEYDQGFWYIVASDASNGLYRVYDHNGNNWYLNYGHVWANDAVDRFSVSSNERTVRLFKKVTGTGGTVTFAGSPYESTLLPGVTQNLTYEVTSTAGTVTDSNIVWATSNSEVATINNGVITTKAVGSATITATLNSVNGSNLASPLKLDFVVTVATKPIDEDAYKLVGSPVTVVCGAEPDYSGVYLTGEYEDGETFTVSNSALEIPDVDTSMPRTQTVKVKYAGKEFNLIVKSIISYDGLEDATKPYPEYPADGAVRIKKTAKELQLETTGLTEVELSVAGVSTKPGVDVILVTDFSNSMARSVEDLNNDGKISDDDCPTDYTKTKLYSLAQSVGKFADVFLAEEDGVATKNTVTLVTFGGYDADYTDSEYDDLTDVTDTHILG